MQSLLLFRRFGNRRRNAVCKRLDKRLLASLHHHPDQRLGARCTQQHAALAVQLLLCGSHCRIDFGVRRKIEFLLKPNIHQHLRKQCELGGELA